MFDQLQADSDSGLSGDESSASPPARQMDYHAAAVEHQLSFRSFTVFPAARMLLRDGRPVCIGGRAFDLLVILLRSRGLVVTKDAITRHVWPSMFVEESNLRFQIGCLRRALGADAELIKTVAGRGYLLAAEAAPRAPDVIEHPASPRGDDSRGANAELLASLLRSAGALVASYGSVEAFLGALASQRG